jgi:hypothetical protein
VTPEFGDAVLGGERRHFRRAARSSLLLLEGEQLLDLHFQHIGEFFEASDRGCIDAAFTQAYQLNRTANGFSQLLLSELSLATQVSDALAEFLLKHAV